ncbi:collectin-10 isoform X2 [Nelusetta ayraudi]|uniref:collectin-10 isoform X2 n=1 Tax=Nelusetta ayraudi TaxID=303726 RepID=UPI003F6E606F
MAGLLALGVFASVLCCVAASTEVCTNSFIPGAKGDQGERGDVGELGRLGKTGPPGLPGVPGQAGLAGEFGQMGKMGPLGDKGTTCDCGRYRKVVGQLDVTIGKLRSAVKFVKAVITGLKETEEQYYLLVKESRSYREAAASCQLRGGSLATPTTSSSNRLLAASVSEAGLSAVFIDVQAPGSDSAATSGHVDSDPSRLQGFTAWSPGEEDWGRSPNTTSSCVQLLSGGTWSRVECEAAMFFICEFPKSRRRGRGGWRGGGGGGGGGGGAAALPSS